MAGNATGAVSSTANRPGSAPTPTATAPTTQTSTAQTNTAQTSTTKPGAAVYDANAAWTSANSGATVNVTGTNPTATGSGGKYTAADMAASGYTNEADSMLDAQSQAALNEGRAEYMNAKEAKNAFLASGGDINSAQGQAIQAAVDAAVGKVNDIRANSTSVYTNGYNAGSWGNEVNPYSSNQQQPQQSGQYTPNLGQAPSVNSADYVLGQMTDALDKWKAAAELQARQGADYATQVGVEGLQRSWEDAQDTFRENQEQIARQEMNNLDNSALYAEARGDKGGIGKAQYDSVMNTAAINQQTVKSEQTKLTTDIQREISDLRAKGEYDKADKILSISQNYLSKLIDLEQFAANYGLSVAKFEEGIREWEASFLESVREFDKNFSLNEAGVTGYYQGNPTFQREQAAINNALNEANVTGYYNGNATFSREKYDQETAASAGQALLSAGILPSDEQLAAMGMTLQQAQSYLFAAQMAAAGGGGGGGGDGSKKSTDSYGTYYEEALAKGYGMTATDYAGWLARNTSLSNDEMKRELENFGTNYNRYNSNTASGNAITSNVANALNTKMGNIANMSDRNEAYNQFLVSMKNYTTTLSPQQIQNYAAKAGVENQYLSAIQAAMN